VSRLRRCGDVGPLLGLADVAQDSEYVENVATLVVGNTGTRRDVTAVAMRISACALNITQARQPGWIS